MLHPDELACAVPIRPGNPQIRVLRSLPACGGHSSGDALQGRAPLLVQQLERLARLTAQDILPADIPPAAALLQELASVERGVDPVGEGGLELLVCRIGTVELLRRSQPETPRRGGRGRARAFLRRLRSDARTLLDWSRADLLTASGRGLPARARRAA